MFWQEPGGAEGSSWQNDVNGAGCRIHEEDWEPAPVVLPQPEWPEAEQTGAERGWRWKEPSVGPAQLTRSYDESRTAVQLAEDRQTEALAESAAPAPGLEDLPEEFQGLDFRVELGVEYRF